MSLSFLSDVAEFKDLVRALRGEPGAASGPPTISGLAGAAKPFFCASLTHALDRPIVFIQPLEYASGRLEEEARFFLDGLGSNRRVRGLPDLTETPFADTAPSLEAVSSRMRFLYDLLTQTPALIVTNAFGLLRPLPPPDRLPGLFLRLAKNSLHDRDGVLERLAAFGYVREDLISFRGEYAGRGGIVDVYSPWQSAPCRIEFGGDEILSLREFDPSTQRSIRRLDSVLIPSLLEAPADAAPAASFRDYLGGSVFIIDGPAAVDQEWEDALAEVAGRGAEPDAALVQSWTELRARAARVEELETEETDGPRFHFPFQSVPRFDNRIPFFLEYLRRAERERDRTYIFFSGDAVRRKVAALLDQNGIPARAVASALESPTGGEALLVLGKLERGFSFPREKIAFFADSDIITEEKVVVSRPSVRPSLTQFQDLKIGDHIVHADYGIGVFQGLLKMEVDGLEREFMELRYRDDDKLFVPVEDLNLVQKYTQVGAAFPPLDKLGTNLWQKTKERTKKAVEKIARELLELYARRKSVRGFSFSPEGEWETEFDKTFEYEETEDQFRSIGDIKNDMEEPAPMDRLLCGDVGYGKTEVAMRAAFKAIMDGKQVAVLCPTTVLASQHLKTFKNRMVLFPARVEALTRLQSKNEQKMILADLKNGQVDVLIGTHRILSKDVAFRDLGLLVVDEEQRFGVGHKEKIKGLKANIDVLTLTATPIPRTLNMSLTGLRDISLIETPPRDRLSVHTVVTSFSAGLVASAIRQELNRSGQVYYVHNRIEDIDKIASLVEKLVPQARVVTIHGQMPGLLLEKRMMDFISRKANVLVSTTIIENGIDIPLVNTLIVNRADLFGLAQLYQLRGRVGRSSRQAFAYFLVPPLMGLTPQAKERLKALKEFSELGSGFRLAAKDLEIRGAGNLLGHRQSGTMEAVGYDYFMHLLDQAIRELKGEAVEEVKTELNLKADIRVPEDYLPQVNLRLNLYKRLSSLDDLESIAKIRAEVLDRFGDIPDSVENLLRYGAIKLLSQKLRIESLDRAGQRLVFKFFPSTGVDLARLPSLLKRYSGSLSPAGVMSLNLPARTDREFLDETVLVLKELTGYTIMD